MNTLFTSAICKATVYFLFNVYFVARFKCPSNAQRKPTLPVFWVVSPRYQAVAVELVPPRSVVSDDIDDHGRGFTLDYSGFIIPSFFFFSKHYFFSACLLIDDH
jgi:hypothetical protein